MHALQLPPLSEKEHIPTLLRQGARLVASWAAQQPELTRRSPAAPAAHAGRSGGGGGGDGGSGGCTLEAAVARRMAPEAVPQLSITHGRCAKMGRAAGLIACLLWQLVDAGIHC